MISYGNNPVQDVIDICNRLYPKLNCELIFAEGIKEKDDACAATVWPDDGSEPQIWIDVSASYSATVELIAHEFAHVVAGHESGHGQEWEKVFDEINSKFNED